MAAIAVALAISVAAGAMVWGTFGGVGQRAGRASGLPPLDEQAIPRNAAGIPTVLVVKCDQQGIEVLTPVVAARADGLHVRAYVTDLPGPNIGVASARAGSIGHASGSEGVDNEFVRPVAIGPALVQCESGPPYGEGVTKQFEGQFEVIDPSGTFIEYELGCGAGMFVEMEHQISAPSAAAAVRAAVNGLRPGDSVEEAGFPSVDPSAPGYVRIVRSGSVVASIEVAKFGGAWLIDGMRTCAASELSNADPSWFTIWSDKSPGMPPPGVSTYVVSAVRLQIQPDIESGVVLVRYRLSWNTETPPGAHRCTTRVFDAAGREIGHWDVIEELPDDTESGFRNLVDGSPARATVECDPERLDA